MSVNVEEMEVEETKSEKLLGLVIDNELTWHEHLHGDCNVPSGRFWLVYTALSRTCTPCD